MLDPDHSDAAIRASGGGGVYLDITQRDTSTTWTHPLDINHAVLGRGDGVAICLDHTTVSRRHAELMRGPFGHWWIHDLGSTNGTYVNGARSPEQLLRPGDVIDVGCFTLVLRAPVRDSRRTVQGDERRGDTPHPGDATVSMSAVDIFAPMARGPAALSSAQLAKVVALGRTLLMCDDEARRLTRACEFMVGEDFPADRAAIVEIVGGKAMDVVCGPARRSEARESPLMCSQEVLRAVWDMRAPVVGHASPRGVAVMALPLKATPEQMDCMYLELAPEHATPEWLTLASFIAGTCEQAELASEMRDHGRVTAAVERELDMARQIQEGLIPRVLRLPGLDTGVRYNPCRWVGGDYVDVVPLPDGRVLLTIADVCGKGLQAALVASSLHTLVRATAHLAGDPGELLERFNTYLTSYLPDHFFVTMTIAMLNPRDGNLVYANAGHPPALVVSQVQRIRLLPSSSPALGMITGSVEVKETTLEHDEVLVMYTDGVIEALDTEDVPFGLDRLGDAIGGALGANPESSADALCNAVAASIEAHHRANFDLDDRAWVVARRVT